MSEPATGQPATPAGGPPPPPGRPVLRRLLSSVLVFEAIILILAVPVAVTIEHLGHGVAFGVGGGLAVAAIVLAGLIGRGRGALIAGTVLQLLIIVAGVEVPAL
jgi:multidrug transporter EmrE-like cation transporter